MSLSETAPPAQIWCAFNPDVLDFGIPENSAVLYSCLFACGLFLTITRFVARARRWVLASGDEGAANAVILPSYLPILYGGIVLNAFRAVVVILYGAICNSAYIDMHPERSRLNWMNNLLYSVYTLSFEWFAASLVMLFCERCVSYRALWSAVSKGLFIAGATTSLAVVSLNYHLAGSSASAHRHFYFCFQTTAVAFPLFALLVPVLITRRMRLSAKGFLWFSIAWRVIFIISLASSWAMDDSTSHTDSEGGLYPGWVLVTMVFFRDTLSPLFVYLALLRDTHYWRGLPQRQLLREYSRHRGMPMSFNTRKRLRTLRLTTPLLGKRSSEENAVQSLERGVSADSGAEEDAAQHMRLTKGVRGMSLLLDIGRASSSGSGAGGFGASARRAGSGSDDDNSRNGSWQQEQQQDYQNDEHAEQGREEGGRQAKHSRSSSAQSTREEDFAPSPPHLRQMPTGAGARSPSTPPSAATQSMDLVGGEATGETVENWLAQPRYPPDDRASNRLQNLLDTVPVQAYIDFAFLEVEYSRLLGRGATASVFVGMLTLKNDQRAGLVQGQSLIQQTQRLEERAATGNDNETLLLDADIEEVLANQRHERERLASQRNNTLQQQQEQEVEQNNENSGNSRCLDEEVDNRSVVARLSSSWRSAEVTAVAFIRQLMPKSNQTRPNSNPSTPQMGRSSSTVSGSGDSAQSEQLLQMLEPDGNELSDSASFSSIDIHSLHEMGEFGSAVVHAADSSANAPSLLQRRQRKVPVAIKMYTPPELDIATIEAYAKETEILTELSHPNIVHYFGLCVSPPHLCLVFALCSNGSLEEYIEQRIQWSPRRRLDIIRDCVRAVEYLHSKSYVHRDLKPGNFLLDDSFRCMLTDFGTCIRITTCHQFIRTDTIAGTMDHMAPEVLAQTRRNMFYGYACDVFSLGILVSSVLNMNMPYDDMTGFQIRHAVLGGHRPSIAQSWPAQIRQCVFNSWKQEPLDRITAAQMLRSLSILS